MIMEMRTFRPTTLNDIIGQEEIVNNLRVYVNSAKSRKEPLEHLLIVSRPGLGKSTLAGALASEMGGKFITVNSPSLKTKGELASIISQLEPNSVLFLDEIHALKRELQELLYPVMEDYKLEIASGTSAVSIDVSPFTLIGATTHQGKLSKPMRDRFGDVCELRLYNMNELFNIIVRAVDKLGFQITARAAYDIASRSQGTPRIALRITRRVRDFALNDGVQLVKSEFVQNVCRQICIDSIGLDSIAIRMLQLLLNKNKAVGLQSIASQLGEAVETIEDCVEPYLLSIGFVERVQSGRIITDKGIRHVSN